MKSLTLRRWRVLVNPEEDECRQNVGNQDGVSYEPPGSRTLNRLIKSQLLFLLS